MVKKVLTSLYVKARILRTFSACRSRAGRPSTAFALKDEGKNGTAVLTVDCYQRVRAGRDALLLVFMR